jgi:hypothetical protein
MPTKRLEMKNRLTTRVNQLHTMTDHELKEEVKRIMPAVSGNFNREEWLLFCIKEAIDTELPTFTIKKRR